MNYLSYRIELYKLNRKRDKEDKVLSKALKEAEKNSYEEAQAVYQTEGYDLFLVDDAISLLRTRYLISKANKLFLPTPPMNTKDGLWERSQYSYNKYYLTAKGIMKMRSSIRKEREESLKLFSQIATILMGLVGIIAGLIAVIKS